MPRSAAPRAAIALVNALVLASLQVLAPAIATAQPPPTPTTPDDAATPGTSDASESVAQPVDPDAPTVGASLDRTDAHLGDQLTLTITAVARAQVTDSVKLARPDL